MICFRLISIVFQIRPHMTAANILKYINDGFIKGLALVFFNLLKASDTLDHSIFQELFSYSIQGLIFKWFHGCFSDSKQVVRISNKPSSMGNISWDVPQGSLLGPLEFLIYINDFMQLFFPLPYDTNNPLQTWWSYLWILYSEYWASDDFIVAQN